MLLALPDDVREKIMARVLSDGHIYNWVMWLHRGPSVARTVLGPGSLSRNGDAYRLVAESFRATRSPNRTTWAAVVAELRREWQAVREEMTLPRINYNIFVHACMHNLPMVVDYHLANFANPNSRFDNRLDDAREPVLWIACRRGNVEMVKKLLAAGADVDGRPEGNPDYETTPLMAAIDGGGLGGGGSSDRLTQILLGAKANTECRDSDGFTALIGATFAGNAAVVKTLIAGNANVDAVSHDGHTALMHACAAAGAAAVANNRMEIMQALLAHGAKVDVCDHEGQTALYVAALAAKVDAVNALLAYGANPNTVAKSPTPLTTAVRFSDGETDVVEALLAAGAEIDTPGRNGCTALMYAARKGYVKCAQVLLRHGATVDPRDDDNGSALTWACANGECAMAKILLDARADINFQQDWCKETPLILASRSTDNWTGMVELLVANGANVNLATRTGYTALCTASSRHQHKVAKVLIDGRADLEARTTLGHTALDIACERGSIQTVNVLIAAGANVNTRCKLGKSALFRASKESVVEALRNAGAVDDEQDGHFRMVIGE